MATYGTMQRPNSISSTSATSEVDPDESKNPTTKKQYDTKRPEFRLVCPFSIPSSPEAAAARIIRNLGHFALYYAHFVWIILCISLIPKRKVSLVYLVIMTYVASLYLLLLRALPSSVLINKVIDRRVVLAFIALVTMVELIVTKAGLHLLVTLAASIPIVLLHAVLWVREDDVCGDDQEETGPASEGFEPLINESSISMV
ncbi:hypothetical protein Tsubulata_027239 [Turnera subulata]|uniref:PRA1 family protein n=1 Tax=Turnera subulata TaxID=218843 RepID=A0A9Q0IZX5_9ROSI|nr:hypothetical protein Tsubulata_027239 [Turnera subulata]